MEVRTFRADSARRKYALPRWPGACRTPDLGQPTRDDGVSLGGRKMLFWLLLSAQSEN